jgi:hypothetical protein
VYVLEPVNDRDICENASLLYLAIDARVTAGDLQRTYVANLSQIATYVIEELCLQVYGVLCGSMRETLSLCRAPIS